MLQRTQWTAHSSGDINGRTLSKITDAYLQSHAKAIEEETEHEGGKRSRSGGHQSIPNGLGHGAKDQALMSS
jgi:hypothetical protein